MGSFGEELREWLQEFLRKEVEAGKLPEEYPEAVSVEKLMHFIGSELGDRMRRARRRGQLYREQPFVYGISADRLNAEFPAEETVLIQGIVDAFFIEEDHIVLVDYKTDIVRSAKELWTRYELQLDYYAEALEHLLEKPVKEKILYSFYLERPVSSGAD